MLFSQVTKLFDRHTQPVGIINMAETHYFCLGCYGLFEEINDLLHDTFNGVQFSVTEAMNNGGINDRTFSAIFSKVASEYKNRMLMIRRESIVKVTDALSEMEKLT